MDTERMCFPSMREQRQRFAAVDVADLPRLVDSTNAANGERLLAEDRVVAGDSKSVNFGSNTWQTASHGPSFRLDQMIVTAFRAAHAGGGYDAYLTFGAGATSLGWKTLVGTQVGGGINLYATLLEANHGSLFHWEIPVIEINCGANNVPVFFRIAIDPDIFPLIGGCSFGQLNKGGEAYKCR